jgi:hypothetical protein
LQLTDSSFILNGEVSILHIVNICKAHDLQIVDRMAVNYLMRIGITQLHHLGKWNRDNTGRWFFDMQDEPSDTMRRWTSATRRSWDRMKLLIKKVCIHWLFEGDEGLLIP